MPVRLVALDEGPDIPVDRAVVVVGRHPQCDARIDSIRVSRRHCCMTADRDEVVVRDLGSTNGIRINGQRVEMGRLRPGDELAIAHIRYRVDAGGGQERTQADHEAGPAVLLAASPVARNGAGGSLPAGELERRVAAAAREAYGERLVKIIVQVEPERAPEAPEAPEPQPCPPDSSP
jgi:predicted component of type VI protein secretion system